MHYRKDVSEQHYRQAVLDWFEQNDNPENADERTIREWVNYLLNGFPVPEELADIVQYGSKTAWNDNHPA